MTLPKLTEQLQSPKIKQSPAQKTNSPVSSEPVEDMAQEASRLEKLVSQEVERFLFGENKRLAAQLRAAQQEIRPSNLVHAVSAVLILAAVSRLLFHW